MVEGGKGENKGRYIIENRIDALIDELNIQVDENQITGYLTSQRLGISRDSIRVVLRDNQVLFSAQIKGV